MTFKQWLAVVYIPLVANHIYAEGNGSYFWPTDPVKKVNDVINFECRSPDGYATKYATVNFVIKHNGSKIVEAEANAIYEGYSIIRESKTVTKQQDAGNYTCDIVPEVDGKVSVYTNVYIIEDDDLTIFGQEGKETKGTCFENDEYTDLPLVTYWKVDGLIQHKGDLTIMETAVVDTFKSYSCLVTSEKAMEAYSNIDNATKNGAVTEMTRSLSVINVSKCKDKSRCALIANVYGNTPVGITWVVDEERHSPALVIAENVTSSNISELNVTRSSSVELIVSGGHSIWRESITLEEDKSKYEHRTSGADVGAIIGGFVGGFVGVVLIVVIIVLVVRYLRKKKDDKNSANASKMQMVASTEKGDETVMEQLDTKEKAEEKEEKVKEEDAAKLLGGQEASTATDTPTTENGST